ASDVVAVRLRTSAIPSPFGLKSGVLSAAGEVIVSVGATVSTTTVPVEVAFPFSQASVPRRVQLYTPDAAGLPPTRPSQVVAASASARPGMTRLVGSVPVSPELMTAPDVRLGFVTSDR